MRNLLTICIAGLALIAAATGQEVRKETSSHMADLGTYDAVGNSGRTGIYVDKNSSLRKGRDEYMFTSKKPSTSEIGVINAGELVGIDVQVGTISDKPVYLQVFTLPEQAKDVPAQLGSTRDKLLPALERASRQDINIQTCTGQSACEKTCVKDGKEYCCRYRCESKSTLGIAR